MEITSNAGEGVEGAVGDWPWLIEKLRKAA